MVYIKANTEIIKVYQRVITSMKERVEWNGDIVIRKNTMILVGRVRSMYFELSSRRVYSDIEEFSLDSAKAFEMKNNKLLTNIINIMLYPFGKWGAVKGLNVEQDYMKLATLFSQIFKEIDVETYFTKMSMKFFIAGIQITFEDAMEKCIEYIEKQREENQPKTKSDKEEKQREEVQADKKPDEENKQFGQKEQDEDKVSTEKTEENKNRKKSVLEIIQERSVLPYNADEEIYKGYSKDGRIVNIYPEKTGGIRSKTGLWHNMRWIIGSYEFKKEKLDEEYANSHRIGNNFYMVPYKCPKCGEFLNMVVFPNGKERIIDTEEGKVYIARAYTCDNCKTFYTPSPERLLIEGDIYILDLDNDEIAAGDYARLLGKEGAKTSNCHFNVYMSEYERELSKVQKKLSEICRNIEYFTNKELEMVIAKMDEGFFSDYEKERFYGTIEQELEYREKIRNKKINEIRKKAEESRKIKEKLQAEQKENIECAADEDIYDNTKDVLQVYENISEYYDFLEAAINEESEKNKIHERDCEVEDDIYGDWDLGAGFKKNKAKADNKKGGSGLGENAGDSDKTDERITAGENYSDEYVNDDTKKDILNGSLENGIENGEDKAVSESVGKKEKSGDNTGNAEKEYSAKGTDKVIRCPSLYDVLIEMGATAKYSELVGYIQKVKRSEGDEQRKLHCLDVLTKMCKAAAKKEVEYMVSHLPENINFDRYKRTKEKIMTFTEIDVSPYIKIVDTKRDKVEFDELNKLVEGVDRDNRSELLDMMEQIENGEYEKRNSDRFVEGLRKRVCAIDEAKIRGICPNPEYLTFDEGLKVLKEIEEGIFLPEIKSNMLQLIDRKLTALKTEECELLVRKLKRDLDGKISNTSKLHFYDIGKMRDGESSDKESSLVKVAISTYAYAAGKYEYPIIICDSSLFGSGKEGFIITPDHIFYKGLIKSGSIDVKNINGVFSKKNGLVMIHMEKGYVKMPCTLSKNDERNMAEVLCSFIDYLKMKPQSRSIEYMSKKEHKVKCCYRCGQVFKDGNVCPRCGSRFDG